VAVQFGQTLVSKTPTEILYEAPEQEPQTQPTQQDENLPRYRDYRTNTRFVAINLLCVLFALTRFVVVIIV
jgi:hypothetical protein